MTFSIEIYRRPQGMTSRRFRSIRQNRIRWAWFKLWNRPTTYL